MYEKLLWINPNVQFLFHANIVEYDMRAMSVSISEKYNLLPKETIEILKLLPKDQRTKKVGLLQRDSKEYSDKLIECELLTRKHFLEINNISEEDVVCLHSDACIFNSKKEIINIVDDIEFKHANTWSSYINYNGIEMFYDNGIITYKGIPKEMLNQHTLGLCKYLCNIFDKVENYDSSVLSFISKFQTKYLQDKLPEYYYIPFGRVGDFKISNLKLFAYIANVIINDMKGW